MRKIETEVLVIGGGATGAGVLRDLSMRGFKAVLVEKGDMTHGTTGRYHGLLHSGGRYVVKDPEAAKECIEENRILRRIMPNCIEDTGGFFVVTPFDDPSYAPLFVEGCKQAGIPVEDVPIDQMLRQEPMLNPGITHCYRVPDGSADSFLATDFNAASARQHGAQVLTYHKVVNLLTSGTPETGLAVTGALVHDLLNDEDVEISADMVVNASGAWAGQVAGMVGIPVQIVPGKGTMVAVNHRILNTVVNRCKKPSDGDIIVPAHTVAVIGTTDVAVTDPDHYAIEPWEVELMLTEGEKLVPGFRELRILRAWAGVRPLYQESKVTSNRELSRAFVLLDHQERDGVSGLVTITSGKWTTYRKMAEVTVDLVCKRLGVQRPCTTQDEPLPGAYEHEYHYLGERLNTVEREQSYGSLVCECELATLEDVEKVIQDGNPKTIDDVRRDARVGMGPCQGGFCTYRVAGMLHTLRSPDVKNTDVALREFLQERWKGLLPILWGQQLRQERLDELIYRSVLNADHLPGPRETILGPVNYEFSDNFVGKGKADTGTQGKKETGKQGGNGELQLNNVELGVLPAPQAENGPVIPDPRVADVLVLGAGLAGLAAGWQAANRGKKARVIAKGFGALYWNAGSIDVLGYYPLGSEQAVQSPRESIAQLIREHPDHPYAITGIDQIEAAIRALVELSEQSGYPLEGTLDQNWLLPTALGIPRPTCLAPQTMIAGDLRKNEPILIAGFKQFPDFYPALIAANLSNQGQEADCIMLDMEALRDQRFVTGRVLALSFDTPEFRAEFCAALKPKLGRTARLGMPAVLGLVHPMEAKKDLESRLGIPVFEIPTLTPSIPGIRLSKMIIQAIEKNGGRVFDGMQATSARTEAGRVQAILTEAAARTKANRGKTFVLATGGILGGGVRGQYGGFAQEMVFNLPVSGPHSRLEWLQRDFLASTGNPIYFAGLQVNSDLRPVDDQGQIIYENLLAVGGALCGWDGIAERSLEGVALATGYMAGNLS